MTLLVLSDARFSLTPAQLVRLGEIAPRHDIEYHPAGSVHLSVLAQSEIIWGAPPPDLLRHAPFLSWLHLSSPQPGRYVDLNLYNNPNLRLTKCSSVYAPVAAEQAVGMLLAVCRQFPLYLRAQASENWLLPHEDLFALTGSTALVVGLGALGQQTASRLSAFGCHVLGVRKQRLPIPDGVDEVYTPRHLAELIPRADHIVVCLPSTPETRGLFSERLLRLLKPTACLVCVGASDVFAPDVLALMLAEGKCAGAAINLTEPLPGGHPLWHQDNVLLTPGTAHIAPDNPDHAFNLFCDLLERYVYGRPLYSQVDFYRQY